MEQEVGERRMVSRRIKKRGRKAMTVMKEERCIGKKEEKWECRVT